MGRPTFSRPTREWVWYAVGYLTVAAAGTAALLGALFWGWL